MSDVFVSAFAAAVSKPGKSVVRSLNSSYEAAAAFHVTDNCFSGLSPLQKDICTDRSILIVCLSKVDLSSSDFLTPSLISKLVT